MEYWEAFQRFEFSNETLIVLGGLLIIIAVLQIIKSSISMIFWVVLAILGCFSAGYGYDRTAVRLPDYLVEEARNLSGPGALTSGVMQALCLKVLNGDPDSASVVSQDWAQLVSAAPVDHGLTFSSSILSRK